MKSRMIVPIALVLALVALGVVRAGGNETGWEFVVDVEARADGTVVATRQARASTCEDDGEGACIISWSWEGESLPADAEEWVKPYGLAHGETIPVAFVPDWCEVSLRICQAKIIVEGEMATVIEPSDECLAELAAACGLGPDERGFWYGGTLPKEEEDYYAFYEPFGEWYATCPLPPPTLTPRPIPPTLTPEPTYTPEPMPTCRPTWTPIPTDTPYPTATPRPTATPWPTQPPF